MLRLAVDDLYRGVTGQKLARYGLTLLGIALTGVILKYFMRRLVIGVSRRLESELRDDLFAHLQKLPVAYFQRHRVGELVSRATQDLAAVRLMLGPGVLYLVNTLAVAVASVAFMLAISPRATFYSLLPLPLVTLTVWFFGSRVHRRFEAVQAEFGRISAQLQENLVGVRVVRAFARETEEVKRFHRMNRDYRARNLELVRIWGILHPALVFLSGLAALLALFLGGLQVVKGRITLGEFVAFTVYLAQLNWPVVALGWVINLWQRGLASFGRIEEMFRAEPAKTGPQQSNGPVRARGEIEMRALSYRHEGAERDALRNVSFRVPSGRTVAVVGATGSGKSTLLWLIPRLYEPAEGMVFFDGMDVRRCSTGWLRSQVALVPQEPFLFSATLEENLMYGTDGATKSDLERAVRIAHLTEDIRALPEGYATRVGERGITLSGGQRQRAAIARALLRDTQVLLMDDCLSSLDSHTEEAILHGLREELHGRTLLMVSHRVSAVCDADLIVVLDEGTLAESGTHDALLARGGRYAELHRLQQLEEELEAS